MRMRCSISLVSSTGGVNLMRHAKKSTNRDFRISIVDVPETDNQAQEEEDEAEEQASQGSDDEIQVCGASFLSAAGHIKSWGRLLHALLEHRRM